MEIVGDRLGMGRRYTRGRAIDTLSSTQDVSSGAREQHCCKCQDNGQEVMIGTISGPPGLQP